MAAKLPVEVVRESLTKPWVLLRIFQGNGVLSRLPEHYKKFYYEWKCAPKTPVHYIPRTGGNFERLESGEVVMTQDHPLPLLQPKELHHGIWGGEAIVKGFTRKKPMVRRVPRYWVPTLRGSVVYSEILDRYMKVTVTNRTLNLIDQHYGFDHYILQTSAADLMSELALKIKRELLLTLTQGTLYPDNPDKRTEMLEKYKEYIIPFEEADWYGLTAKEAAMKQKILEDKANTPTPLKHTFRAEFVAHLKAKKFEDPESPVDGGWLSRVKSVNPFAKS